MYQTQFYQTITSVVIILSWKLKTNIIFLMLNAVICTASGSVQDQNICTGKMFM